MPKEDYSLIIIKAIKQVIKLGIKTFMIATIIKDSILTMNLKLEVKNN